MTQPNDKSVEKAREVYLDLYYMKNVAIEKLDPWHMQAVLKIAQAITQAREEGYEEAWADFNKKLGATK